MRHIKHILSVFLLSLTTLVTSGQDSIPDLQPLRQTDVRRCIYDIYVFCVGGCQENGNVWTANNNRSVTHLYGTYLNLGSTVETTIFKIMTVGYSLGYKYEPYSSTVSLFDQSAFNTHWLSNDLLLCFQYIGVGVKSDVYLYGNLDSRNNFELIGLNSNCFNKISVAGYLNFAFRFTNFKLDVNGGLIFRKKLSVDAIAYYNMNKSYADEFFIEFKISYRLFTTGNRRSSQSQLQLL